MAAENHQHNGDAVQTLAKPPEHTEAHSAQADLSRAVHGEPGMAVSANIAKVANTADHHLPAMAIDGNHHEAQKGGYWEAFKDVVHGAVKEAEEHPWQLAKDAAIGAAVGTVAVVAAPGLAAAIGVGAAVGAVELNGGFAKTGSELWHGATNLVHNAEVVAAPQGHSAAEQAKAKAGLEEAGAVSAHIIAGAAGSVAGGFGGGMLRAALTNGGKAAVVADTIGSGTATTVASEAALGARVTGKIVAATGEGAKDSSLSQGTLTLADKSLAYNSHAEVNAAVLTQPDGTKASVFFHANDTAPGAATARLAKEEAGYQLNKMVGFENSYPKSQAVDIAVGGKVKSGWLQEGAGKPLEDTLREKAMQQFGTTANMNEDVAKILDADPALKKQVEQAVVERMVYGDHDIAAANIGVDKGAVRNFDMGEAFGDDHVPVLSSRRSSLPTVGLQTAFSGKPLSEGMRQTLRNFVTAHDSAAGLKAIQDTGLQPSQAQAVLERSRWLADGGKMPVAADKATDPESVAWYKMMEREHSAK